MTDASLPRMVNQIPGGDGENDRQDLEHEDLADVAVFAPELEETDASLPRTSGAGEESGIGPFSRDASGLAYEEDCDEKARLSQWLDALKKNEDLPPLMWSALAFEALGRDRVFAALCLARSPSLPRHCFVRDKARHHLTARHAGFRHAQHRHPRRQDLMTRPIDFARAIEAIAKRERREIDRLALARESRACRNTPAGEVIPSCRSSSNSA